MTQKRLCAVLLACCLAAASAGCDPLSVPGIATQLGSPLQAGHAYSLYDPVGGSSRIVDHKGDTLLFGTDSEGYLVTLYDQFSGEQLYLQQVRYTDEETGAETAKKPLTSFSLYALDGTLLLENVEGNCEMAWDSFIVVYVTYSGDGSDSAYFIYNLATGARFELAGYDYAASSASAVAFSYTGYDAALDSGGSRCIIIDKTGATSAIIEGYYAMSVSAQHNTEYFLLTQYGNDGSVHTNICDSSGRIVFGSNTDNIINTNTIPSGYVTMSTGSRTCVYDMLNGKEVDSFPAQMQAQYYDGKVAVLQDAVRGSYLANSSGTAISDYYYYINSDGGSAVGASGDGRAYYFKAQGPDGYAILDRSGSVCVDRLPRQITSVCAGRFISGGRLYREGGVEIPLRKEYTELAIGWGSWQEDGGFIFATQVSDGRLLYDVLDCDGNILVEGLYYYNSTLNADLLAVQRGDEYGLMDYTGRWLVRYAVSSGR